MPGLGGVELARRVRARHAGLPVLFVSGYVHPLAQDEDAIAAGENLMLKPFTPSQLAARVRGLLDERGTSATA